ncbi:hypothetical protein ANCCEY_03835 [Ancylostoma ceylanicum]|uniref:Uncharacterized protein n=1 Tax=Ancylostoma ceylanicum TaxID=53326 RepID=A0A0D6LYZ5_9BILA|nr:hypothetical protein ANCCEY_03835 [Ancylostoma ceylanicum]
MEAEDYFSTYDALHAFKGNSPVRRLELRLRNVSSISKVVWSSFDFMCGPELKFVWEVFSSEYKYLVSILLLCILVQIALTSTTGLYDSMFMDDSMYHEYHLSSRGGYTFQELRYLDEFMMNSNYSGTDSSATMTDSRMQNPLHGHSNTRSTSSATTLTAENSCEELEKKEEEDDSAGLVDPMAGTPMELMNISTLLSSEEPGTRQSQDTDTGTRLSHESANGSFDDEVVSVLDLPLDAPSDPPSDELFVSKFVLAEQVFRQEWYMERQQFFESVVLDIVPRLKASMVAEDWEDVVIRANVEFTRLMHLVTVLDRYPLVSESRPLLYELTYLMQCGALATWPLCVVDVDRATVCMSAPYSRHRILKQRADAQRIEIVLEGSIRSKPVMLELSSCRILDCVKTFLRRVDLLPVEESARMGLVNQLLLYVENMARALIVYVQHASEPLPTEKSSATKSSRFSLSECRKALDLQSDGWFHAVLARAELISPDIAEFIYSSG